MTALRRAATAVTLALALATGCGGDDTGGESQAAPDPTPSPAPETEASVTDEAPADDPVTTDTATPEPTPTSEPTDDVRALLLDGGLAEIELQPTTETGPHPTLSWDPVAGAASYWVAVQTSEGDATWAWVGTATSVRVGGGNSAGLNQTAAVHSQMQWVVTAFDAEGGLIALSRAGSLSP